MSDNKTIQDALAEVQRKVNEERAARVSQIVDEATATMLDPSGKKIGTTDYQRVPGSSVGKTATATAGRTAGRSLLGRAASVLGGPAVAGTLAAAEVLKPTPAGETKSEFQRQKEMGISPKPMSSISPAPSAPTADKGRTGVGINKVMNRGKETPAEPLKMAKVEPKTFGQAFSAARKAASEKGSAASGQFEFKGKTYQTNVKGEKYVAPPKQTAVSTSKEVPLPPTKPADLNKPAAKPMSDIRDARPTSGISPAPSTPKAPESTSTLKNLPLDTSKPLNSTISKEPVDTSKPSISKQTNLEYESGGKKAKKMSEDTNPLITAFLKLQDENPGNMFEAAKKAKKDYDKDGKIESPKDEVWGSRFRAAKAAGKMEEGALDPKDSDATPASKTITKTKPAEDPSTPKSYPGAASSLTPDNPTTKRMSNAVKEDEEITFSEAELEHFNRFFLEASVAPNRPEVATGADSTSDKMSQNDVTGTSTESGKKKKTWKEEVELEEGRSKKNPEPETTERDPRQHIQVMAGRAAAGNVLDFKHDNGSVSKLTPGMGRSIIAHLNTLKPADRQSTVNKMHASPEGLKV